jgi:ubiquinone/menaquinone biosynthesis C-methylase UbiE
MPEKSFHEIELEAWRQRAVIYDRLFAPVTRQAVDVVLDSLGDLQGRCHLDVACGTGHLVAAATQRGACSEGVDFAPEMVQAAHTNYPEHCFKIADATGLPYEDGAFAGVSCAFGLSHMADPQSAINEAYRVLQLGGCYTFTLWRDGKDGCDLDSLVKPALKKHIAIDVSLPEGWTRWRLADEHICRQAARQAGFSEPTFKRFTILWQTSSAQEVVELLDKLSVRTRMVIERQPEEAQQAIYTAIRTAAEARRTDGVISLYWHALLTLLQKPG